VTPFDTNWKRGSGATPLTTRDLLFGDAISTPTAPTKVLLILLPLLVWISNFGSPLDELLAAVYVAGCAG
jgi:hypothetical protein